MNAPRNADSAICETSSPRINGNERGVAELLADAYADTIEPTANVAMTSMLEAMILSNVSVDSLVIAGK